MATDIDSLQIQIDAQASKANDAIDRLIGKLDKLATSLANVDGSDKLSTQGSKTVTVSNNISKGLNKASNSATRTNKSFKSLAYVFGKFYANCFLAIRGVKALWKSINSTADYLEAFNYFEVALNKVGGDWSSQYEKYGYANAEAYANSFKTRLNESLKGLSGVQISVDADGKTGLLTDTGMKNLGLNIKEVTQYASQLASVTNSVGQTGEVTLATASAFTKLGADMSSLFNVDYSSVMNNLQSGLIGQSRALYKYGIDITNATLQTYAYKVGVSKAVSEMTQSEKMQLRMIAILDQSRVAWGDQANTINSLSNSIRQFKNNISEAGQILGQLFVPIMSKLMPIVNGVTIAIKRLMVSIAGIMGVKLNLSEFGQGTSDIAEDMDGLADSLDGVANSANAAKNGVRSFDKLNALTTSSKNEDTSIAGIDLTDDILKATEEYEKAWQEAYDRMENQAIAFADRIEKSLEPIKKIFEDISAGDWFEVGEDSSKLVSGILNFFADALDKVDWESIGEAVGEYFSGLDWTGIFESVAKIMWEKLEATVGFFKGLIKKAPFESAIIASFSLMSFKGMKFPLFASSITKAILGALANPFSITLPELLISFSTVSVSPVGAEIGLKILDKIEEWTEEKFGQKVNEGIGEAISFATLTAGGALVGGPIGAAIGGLLGAALNVHSTPEGYTVDFLNEILNFDNARYFFDNMLEDFKDVFNSDNLFEIGSNIVSGILNGIIGTATGTAEPFVDLFNWIIKSICKLFGIHSPAKETEFIGENIVLGISEGFSTGFPALKERFKELWNSIADFLNEKMVLKIDPIKVLGKTLFAGATIDLGFIPKFETGGFVEPNLPNRYSLLMAGEHGTAEMLGTVGGKTAIAGGAEITGISDTIREKSNEEIALLKKQNSLLQSILEKEFGISKNDIGRAAQDYARDYSRRTGREAYSF